MQKIRIKNGRDRVIDVRDYMHGGCEMRHVFYLRAADGTEWRLEEIWTRPVMGRHRRVWRGEVEPMHDA
ncbi:hypothetical protein J4558_00170 [Leptolyngbya sp. 15MV]|nr:hypothetical protein J4558_00170 [Leptolyngbya sp. 15MV]